MGWDEMGKGTVIYSTDRIISFLPAPPLALDGIAIVGSSTCYAGRIVAAKGAKPWKPRCVVRIWQGSRGQIWMAEWSLPHEAKPFVPIEHVDACTRWDTRLQSGKSTGYLPSLSIFAHSCLATLARLKRRG
jgi:hypothetical protein